MSRIAWLVLFLLTCGTLGLLLNEWMITWSRPITLTFAFFNIAGLVALALAFRRSKRNPRSKPP